MTADLSPEVPQLPDHEHRYATARFRAPRSYVAGDGSLRHWQVQEVECRTCGSTSQEYWLLPGGLTLDSGAVQR